MSNRLEDVPLEVLVGYMLDVINREAAMRPSSFMLAMAFPEATPKTIALYAVTKLEVEFERAVKPTESSDSPA